MYKLFSKLTLSLVLLLPFGSAFSKPLNAEAPVHGKNETPVGKSSVVIPDIFSSGMVIQQNRPINIWGTGDNTDLISIEFEGEKKTANVINSKWNIVFMPRKASHQAQSMSISNKGVLLRKIDDILIGEVWLASGQSNMEMRLDLTYGLEEALKRPADPLLRSFKVPRSLLNRSGPLNTPWEEAAPGKINGWSAIAYQFAVELREKLQTPVAIINTAVGASVNESWCSPELLAKGYPEWDAYWKTIENDPKPSLQCKPSTCYNGILKSVMPYGICGVIWYQGEGNAARWKEQPQLFIDMVQEWRTHWSNPELPFFFVQLARYDVAQWHDFRNAQRIAWEKLPNSFMAVSIDLSKDVELPVPPTPPHKTHPIHPATKKPLGHRLALAAKALVYGEKNIIYSGPRIKKALRAGNNIRLSFDFVGQGLSTMDGQDLRGFYLAGPDGKFVSAQAKIQKDTVVIDVPDKMQPSKLRYGSEQDMTSRLLDVNLGNAEKLPASPFTVDVK